MNNIILNNEVSQKPMLKKSDKYSSKDLSKRLLEMIYNSYDNSIEPLLVTGLAIMAPFRNLFLKNVKGFPVAYLYGLTSAGKSTILKNIAFLHGFNEHYIYIGDSTVLSMWENLDKCSCIPIIYDEISKRTINDGFFEGLIKAAFQGITRDKIAKIKTTINATLIISSNFQPPQKPEILNRLVLCNFDPKRFKADKVKFFEEIGEEYLSNILPAIVRQKHDLIWETFKEQINLVEKLNPKLQIRCKNNIAIATTGYQILLKIAEEVQTDEISNNYKLFIENYDKALKLETPWEEFITALPLLARSKAIKFNTDYNYTYDKAESEAINYSRHLCLHFEQAYKVFSTYYRQLKRDFPPTQKEILLYAKNDERIIAGKSQVTKGINIGGVKKRCLVIDLKDNYELSVLDKMQ